VDLGWQGTRITFAQPIDGVDALTTRAIGEVFAENAVAAFALAVNWGVPAAAAASAIGDVAPPPGRFEVIAKRPHVVIDYAHTPDALERTVRTAKSLCTGKLTVVFGAGGNRDQKKRAPMGAAAKSADRILLTSDNPRSEDPRAIAKQIAAGIGSHDQVETVIDRRTAIQRAIAEAAPSDVVLIAGRGHETQQTIGTEVIAFSDVAVARECVANRNRHQS
jgi:UDP-N-acetylmuramyl-tripeptide synthetase